jgi:F0F1-type ATP synthase membrane subunit b/b'
VSDNLESAVRAYQEAQAAVGDAQSAAERLIAEAKADTVRARERLADAIVEAARDGMRQVDIVRKTGYTRERVRQICRAAGIEADQD